MHRSSKFNSNEPFGNEDQDSCAAQGAGGGGSLPDWPPHGRLLWVTVWASPGAGMTSLSLQSQGHLLLASMAGVTLGLLSWHRQHIGYPHLVPKSSADPGSMVVIPNQPKTLVQPYGPRQTHTSSGAASSGSPSPFYITRCPGL